MGGWNNNPSAKQYCAIHRCLIQQGGVSPEKLGNVTPQDETDLLVIGNKSCKRPTRCMFNEPLHSNWQTTLLVSMSPFIETNLIHILIKVVKFL